MYDLQIDEIIRQQAEDSYFHGLAHGKEEMARHILALIQEMAPKSRANAIDAIEQICRESLAREEF